MKEARAALTEARQALRHAKDDHDRLQQQQQSDDEILRWEAARDFLNVYQRLLACEIAFKKAERRYHEVFEKTQASLQAEFLQRLRQVHAELIPVLDLAYEKNEALRQVHAAAEAQGVRLPQVHLSQLTREFLNYWHPISRRELGVGQNTD